VDIYLIERGSLWRKVIINFSHRGMSSHIHLSTKDFIHDR